MQREASELVDLRVPERCRAGTLRRAGGLSRSTDSIVLDREVFGPILHVIRWQRGHLDKRPRCDQRDRLWPDARPP